jgi:hypothetical protein
VGPVRPYGSGACESFGALSVQWNRRKKGCVVCLVTPFVAECSSVAGGYYYYRALWWVRATCLPTCTLGVSTRWFRCRVSLRWTRYLRTTVPHSKLANQQPGWQTTWVPLNECGESHLRTLGLIYCFQTSLLETSFFAGCVFPCVW